MRYIILVALFTLCNISMSSAETIIYPRDLAKAEYFDREGLKIIQCEVDNGHQPWRADPVYYAKHFINFYYPNLNPNDREKLSAELIIENEKTSVKVAYNGGIHIVYLHKAFPANTESIWVVEKMVIK